MRTTLRKRLKRGALLLGTMISEVRNPNIAYMLVQAGFDFFIIDNEHGSFNPETIAGMIAAARGAGIAVIVRIPEIRRECILKPLDAGANGLLVPVVETADQVREILRHAKYPPQGSRGAVLRRAHSFYAKPDPAKFLRQANDETVIAVQIENPRAINNLDEIASVVGVDALFVGPFDLSVSLGFPGQSTHPAVREAIGKVVSAGKKHKLATGIHLYAAAEKKSWIEKGMRFVSYGADIQFLADSAARRVAELRNYPREKKP